MKEIGGYFELDAYHLPMLHEEALALNCGRNALAYLLKARNIKRLWVPNLICESVTDVCVREGVTYDYYSIGYDFLPTDPIHLEKDEWLYFVNYYSQFDNATIAEYFNRYDRIIIDNAQSYFQLPVPKADTIYTCRKYFGVSDGGFLYSDVPFAEELPIDYSHERIHFVLGRYERPASVFYYEASANNSFFTNEPVKRMSKLTYNLLHGIDYASAERIRIENYRYLQMRLGCVNQLKLNDLPGTFMYPLMIENGCDVRKRLQKLKIYIPTLWPSVLQRLAPTERAYRMASDILPLPIDQRYCKEDMEYLARCVCDALGNSAVSSKRGYD